MAVEWPTRSLNRAWVILALVCAIGLGTSVATAASPLSRHRASKSGATCCAGDGYWIVSARDCDGELGPSQASRLRVWRFDADGRGQCSTLPDLYASLSPVTPVCVMMHGSFVNWDSVRHDSQQTNRWLRSASPGTPLHVIFFTWPSDNTLKLWLPRDVKVLGQRASRNAFYVAELISMIPADHPISLVGHSHGGRMAASTLHLLAGGEVDETVYAGGPYQGHRIRTVLAAAAFDHHWLNPGQRYSRAMESPEAVLNLVNRRDLALRFYPLHQPLRTVAAVARSGLTPGDRAQIGAHHVKLVDYDITDRVRAGHIWNHYYEDDGIAQLISPYVFFNDMAVSEPVLPLSAVSPSPEFPALTRQ